MIFRHLTYSLNDIIHITHSSSSSSFILSTALTHYLTHLHFSTSLTHPLRLTYPYLIHLTHASSLPQPLNLFTSLTHFLYLTFILHLTHSCSPPYLLILQITYSSSLHPLTLSFHVIYPHFSPPHLSTYLFFTSLNLSTSFT